MVRFKHFLHSLLLLFTLGYVSCTTLETVFSPTYLRVQVVEDETGEPINGLEVDASSKEAGRIPPAVTNSSGFVKFDNIQSTPFTLRINDPEKKYESLSDSVFQDVKLADTLYIRLAKLLTTIRGKVLADSTYAPIDSCLVRVVPSNVSGFTDERGVFVFRTEQIVQNLSYNITAEHEAYNLTERQSLQFQINSVNDIGAIVLERRERHMDSGAGEIEAPPPLPGQRRPY